MSKEINIKIKEGETVAVVKWDEHDQEYCATFYGNVPKPNDYRTGYGKTPQEAIAAAKKMTFANYIKP